MSPEFITDPFFYAVAVPAVLLLGISKSGFGAGFGSLAVPLMATAVSVPQAAAILMPVLLLMDTLGVAAFRKDVDWKLLKFLMPWGLLGALVGTLLFKWMDAHLVAGMVGVLTLLFLAQKLLFKVKDNSAAPSPWVGRLLTTLSGFTSFVAHSGGPAITVYAMALRLSPVVYAATLSYFFFFINLSKWVPYAWLGLLDWRSMSTALVLLPLAPMGVWTGVWLAKRIAPTLFYRLVNLGLLLTGCKLVWDGFF